MQIAILGRQPELGVAELERIYGADNVGWFSDIAALVNADSLEVNKLGGSQKAGIVVFEGRGNWREISQKLVRYYFEAWSERTGKTTVGISAYGFDVSAREVQKTGIILKSKLKQSGVSLRLIPNDDTALSSATSHHNKLGLSDNKVELLIVRSASGKVVIAESSGAQNITALARRDQNRPKRDAFVGMLPPKLALMMVNFAAGRQVASAKDMTLIDPFCGTGVLLQEAALLGFNVYGTDLSDKMVDYTTANLDWLKSSHRIDFDSLVHQGDATTTIWKKQLDVVACETYLGQPFSAPPSPTKLKEVRTTCNLIISKFLTNISGQIKPGTQLCLAVPAWRDHSGNLTHLPLIGSLSELGYRRIELHNISHNQLVYFREDQVVARQLLIIEKI
jgi:tRNA (guanine10-N2)-dimethyltransferase